MFIPPFHIAFARYARLLLFCLLFSGCAKFPDIDLCQFEGKGTEEDPYILCHYADLMEKLQDSANFSAHFAMYANIDAREGWAENPPSGMTSCIAFDGSNSATATCEGWEAVGNLGTMGATDCSGAGANCFTGSFDGRGHSISNLWVNRDDLYMGFFGALGNPASIRNLGLRDIHIRGGAGGNGIGSLAGVCGGDISPIAMPQELWTGEGAQIMWVGWYGQRPCGWAGGRAE